MENRDDLSVVSNVSNVSFVSNNTDKKDKTDNGHLLHILGSGQKEQILSLLFNGQSLSYSQISERTSIKYDSIIKTMERSSDLFQEVGKEGATKLFGLSPKGNLFVEQAIKEYEETQQKLVDFTKVENLRSIADQELKSEIQGLIEDIKKSIEKKNQSLIINFEDIADNNPALGDKLLDSPEQFFEVLKEIGFLGDNETKYYWRIKNLPQFANKPLELLRSEQIGRFISCKARIVSRTEVRPKIVCSRFECPSCGTIISIVQDDKLKKPNACSCGRRGGFRVIANDLMDISKIFIEDLRGNGKSINPSRAKAIATGELCSEQNIDVLTPGNEVQITGILKEREVSIGKGETSTILDQYIEINHIQTIEPEADLSQITEQELEEIKELQSKIDTEGLNVLTSSIAPHIFKDKQKNEVVKALCLQASTPENNINADNVRTQLNTLLIGDPGIAKSQLAEFILDCVPGSQKAVGGGSSAVGITASVVKEPEEFGGYRVEAGTLPRAKVLCLIDELNNLSDEDKPKLQEGMESKFVTINKANIHTRIPVTAGIIATANPIKGRFTNEHSIGDEFNIPLPILNRFDVIFPFFDKVDSETDGNIARKIIERKTEKIKATYSVEFLRKFFLYLRAQKEPEINLETSQKLVDVYVNARKEQPNNPLINPRFQNTLLRFVLASARIRGKSFVDSEDIKRALEILGESYFKLGDWRFFLSEDKGGSQNANLV
jgi:DNA replicative helicase MCM subunit Mcm2 (Cdc46/Mcm family)